MQDLCKMQFLCLIALSMAVCSSHAATNVAKGKDAWYSSGWSPDLPATAVTDGSNEATFTAGGHCSHNANDVENPYIVVDLCNEFEIKSVELWVRGAEDTKDRDKDIEIRVGNEADFTKNPICTKFTGAVPRQAKADCARPMTGRYISAQRAAPGKEYMHICELMAFSDDSDTGSCIWEKSVTKGKHAWYSSALYAKFPASAATDGKTAADFSDKPTCSHTNNDIENPYLIVDMCNVYDIKSVELWVRNLKGYESRDKDLEIRIGNDVEFKNNPVCARFEGNVPRAVAAKCSKPLSGRYLSIQRMAAGKEYMQICEVMAYPVKEDNRGCMSEDDINIAEGKKAWISSEFSPSTLGDKITDGKTEATFDATATCSHTSNNIENPYAVVDLCESYEINSIELWVRGEIEVKGRDVDLEVRIGDNYDFTKNPVCAFFAGEVAQSVTAMCGSGMKGRFVSVQRKAAGKNYLQVCELKAFTSESKKPCIEFTNVALGKNARYSSDYDSTLPASRSTDGSNEATFGSDGHCSHTGNDVEFPYTVIDLCTSYTIEYLALWVRGDAKLENRDRDFEIRIGDEPDFTLNPVCKMLSGIVPRPTITACDKPLKGRYISVQRKAPGAEYMHVCELLAYSKEKKKECDKEVPPIDVCKLPRSEGTGEESLKRFFFKRGQCKCVEMKYKGKGGNLNNFETLEACQERCPNEIPDECLQKPDRGTCDEKIPKYAFVKSLVRCHMFKYSGCGGNTNRFDNKWDCEDKCLPNC